MSRNFESLDQFSCLPFIHSVVMLGNITRRVGIIHLLHALLDCCVVSELKDSICGMSRSTVMGEKCIQHRAKHAPLQQTNIQREGGEWTGSLSLSFVGG